MAEERGRSTEADKAAVPLADGGADDHTEEVRTDGGTSGIYRMTLCKTEKIPGCRCHSGRRYIVNALMGCHDLALSR